MYQYDKAVQSMDGNRANACNKQFIESHKQYWYRRRGQYDILRSHYTDVHIIDKQIQLYSKTGVTYIQLPWPLADACF